MLFRQRVGSTLAELLVALGILVPVIVVAVGIFPYAHVANRRASDLLGAYDFACQQMELARNTSFDSLASSTATQTVRNVQYTCQMTVSNYDAGDNPVMLKSITVLVTWQTKESESLELDTIVPRINR